MSGEMDGRGASGSGAVARHMAGNAAAAAVESRFDVGNAHNEKLTPDDKKALYEALEAGAKKLREGDPLPPPVPMPEIRSKRGEYWNAESAPVPTPSNPSKAGEEITPDEKSVLDGILKRTPGAGSDSGRRMDYGYGANGASDVPQGSTGRVTEERYRSAFEIPQIPENEKARGEQWNSGGSGYGVELDADTAKMKDAAGRLRELLDSGRKME